MPKYTQLNHIFKIFLEEYTPDPRSNRIGQRYARQRMREVLQYLLIISKIITHVCTWIFSLDN